MRSYRSQSAVIPVTWDTESSAVVVYHNHNVEKIPATQEDPVMYAYDVTEYTRAEYSDIAAPKRIAELEAALQAIEDGIDDA